VREALLQRDSTALGMLCIGDAKSGVGLAR